MINNNNISSIKVLVTGGSGFIGTNAINFLIKNGIETINVDFNPPKEKSHVQFWKNINILNYKLLEEEFLSYQPTHVLHLAATLGMEQHDLEFFSTNTDGVKNILDCCQKTSSVRQVLFTSSLLVCVNGYIPIGDTDYCPPNNYGKSKMIGEKIVRSMDCPRFIWSIVRPTSIWGPWFAYSYRTFFQTIKRGYYFHLGNSKITKPNSFVGNTVYMMLKILFAPSEKVNQKTFYLADYPSYTTRHWADTIQEKMGVKPIKTLPIWILRFIGYGGDILKAFGYKNFPLTSFRLANMMTGGFYPIEKTKNVCGALPHSLYDGVEQTINWMKEVKDI